MLFINKDKAIKEICDGINEVKNVDAIDVDSIRSEKVKLAKFKILV